MPVRVATIGIDLPDDFPHRPYDAVHAKVHSAQRTPDQTFHYGGAWNGIVYRFLSCAIADDRFTELVGEEPGHPNRFHQEEALFNFFVNGLSVIESFFYGLYWIGSMAELARFPIVADNDLRRITVDSTMGLFKSGPHTALFVGAFARLKAPPVAPAKPKDTPEYEELKEVRNILAHRASYGRVLHGAVGGGQQPDDEWRVRNIPINDQVTRIRRNWLAATLKDLLDSAEEYANATL